MAWMDGEERHNADTHRLACFQLNVRRDWANIHSEIMAPDSHSPTGGHSSEHQCCSISGNYEDAQ